VLRGVKAWSECPAFFGVAGFAPTPNFEQTFSCNARVAPRSPPCSFCYKCILQGAIDFTEAVDAMRSWMRGAEWNAARSSAWQALHLS